MYDSNSRENFLGAGTQITSQTLMQATMGARKQDQLEANLKLILMSIWSSFYLDANTSTCGLPSIDAWRPGYCGNIYTNVFIDWSIYNFLFLFIRVDLCFLFVYSCLWQNCRYSCISASRVSLLEPIHGEDIHGWWPNDP